MSDRVSFLEIGRQHTNVNYGPRAATGTGTGQLLRHRNLITDQYTSLLWPSNGVTMHYTVTWLCILFVLLIVWSLRDWRALCRYQDIIVFASVWSHLLWRTISDLGTDLLIALISATFPTLQNWSISWWQCYIIMSSYPLPIGNYVPNTRAFPAGCPWLLE